MSNILKYAIETIEIERGCFAREKSSPEAIKRLDQAGATVIADDGAYRVTFGGIAAETQEGLAATLDAWLIAARRVFMAGAGQ